MSAPIKLSNEFKKKYGHEVAKYRTDHLDLFDREISNLGSAVNIEIMPGENDLSTVALPQKPIPKTLFPSIAKYNNVKFSSNPNGFDLDGVRFIGTSGQSLDDCYRHCLTEDRLLLAHQMLKWRNICPTAPDSLCIAHILFLLSLFYSVLSIL